MGVAQRPPTSSAFLLSPRTLAEGALAILDEQRMDECVDAVQMVHANHGFMAVMRSCDGHILYVVVGQMAIADACRLGTTSRRMWEDMQRAGTRAWARLAVSSDNFQPTCRPRATGARHYALRTSPGTDGWEKRALSFLRIPRWRAIFQHLDLTLLPKKQLCSDKFKESLNNMPQLRTVVFSDAGRGSVSKCRDLLRMLDRKPHLTMEIG